MSADEDTREIPIEDEAGGGEPEPEAGDAEEAVAVEDREEELRALQDQLLRLQAEFQNYRKREARERAAAWARAKGDLAQKLLGALDDLHRVAHLDPAVTAAPAVIDGVQLVERKLVDTLRREGLTPVGEGGEPFDPNLHEAIGMWPAPSPELDGTIAAVTVPGYKLGAQLLRPAQVQVYGRPPDA
ncbi:MAG: nucleotide exchange factor GrpE [Gemmatimonadetes bacterium]|nr:nucleotide exchange factor GrpE [Gemmatimonadota bacterium]